MTQTYAAAFAVFAVVMLAMSVGVIFSGRFIRKSCGDLAREGDGADEHECVCGGRAAGTCSRQDGAATLRIVGMPADASRPLHETPVRGVTSAAGA